MLEDVQIPLRVEREGDDEGESAQEELGRAPRYDAINVGSTDDYRETAEMADVKGAIRANADRRRDSLGRRGRRNARDACRAPRAQSRGVTGREGCERG